jgi:hypothetical protein
MYVASGIHKAMRVRHIDICGLSGSIILLHIISHVARLKKKLFYVNVCFDLLYNLYLNIPF